MKKQMLSVLLTVLLLLPSVCFAVDLSGMSFDELIDLRSQLEKEILSRPEWKEVTVPAGRWIVGQDIPEGTYCIKKDISITSLKIFADPEDDMWTYLYAVTDENTIGNIRLEKGWIVENSYSVIFTPAISLGF